MVMSMKETSLLLVRMTYQIDNEYGRYMFTFGIWLFKIGRAVHVILLRV